MEFGAMLTVSIKSSWLNENVLNGKITIQKCQHDVKPHKLLIVISKDMYVTLNIYFTYNRFVILEIGVLKDLPFQHIVFRD